jgi:hypothetical protein
VACGGSSPFASHPRSKPGPWRELTSEHFTIWTDTSAERARVLVPTLENFRQVVVGVSAFNETKGKTFVIAFDSLDEVHTYVPVQFIAEAWAATSVLRQPVIVLAAESLEDDRSIVTHELTHAITFNVIENQPRWFAEGIASYFETVRLDEGKATLDIGVPQQGRMRELVEEGGLPMTKLFACDRPACADDQYYATAWALFTYLVNEHPKELMQYMEKLAASKYKELAPKLTIDVDLDDAGAVTGVRVVMGSPATNACVEGILRGLAWPAGHPGTFHMGTKGQGG